MDTHRESHRCRCRGENPAATHSASMRRARHRPVSSDGRADERSAPNGDSFLPEGRAGGGTRQPHLRSTIAGARRLARPERVGSHASAALAGRLGGVRARFSVDGGRFETPGGLRSLLRPGVVGVVDEPRLGGVVSAALRGAASASSLRVLRSTVAMRVGVARIAATQERRSRCAQQPTPFPW